MTTIVTLFVLFALVALCSLRKNPSVESCLDTVVKETTYLAYILEGMDQSDEIVTRVLRGGEQDRCVMTGFLVLGHEVTIWANDGTGILNIGLDDCEMNRWSEVTATVQEWKAEGSEINCSVFGADDE